MNLDRFRAVPLLGILRGIEAGAVAPLVETAAAAGINSIEITMNTPGAAELIRRAVAAAGDALMIGAGTVLSVDDLAAALDAGASFAVSPVLQPAVVARCVERRVPVFPGALTPQEIHAAWAAGATMVKVFPASCFGPSYLREIRGPFATVELLACGGVNATNLGEYFRQGAAAVAFGSSVFRPAWLAAGDFASVRAALDDLVRAWHAWRDTRRE